jgi:hypothetical protein
MKIKLTSEQKQKMNQIFILMNELSADKNFIKQLKFAENNFDSNNDDSCSLANFTENIIDTAKCNFNYYNLR